MRNIVNMYVTSLFNKHCELKLVKTRSKPRSLPPTSAERDLLWKTSNISRPKLQILRYEPDTFSRTQTKETIKV